MRNRRITGLLASAAALTAMAIAPAVSGANHGINTTIKLTEQRPALHGVLASNQEQCERGRLVVVKRIRNNRPNTFVGRDYSSFNGGWSVDVNRPGLYNVRIYRTWRSSLGAYCSPDEQRAAIG